MNGDFVGVAEAALILGVHEETIRRRIRKGDIIAKKISSATGSYWAINKSALTENSYSTDVVPLNKPINIDDLNQMIDIIVSERSAGLVECVSKQNQLIAEQSKIIQELNKKIVSQEKVNDSILKSIKNYADMNEKQLNSTSIAVEILADQNAEFARAVNDINENIDDKLNELVLRIDEKGEKKGKFFSRFFRN